MSAAGRPGLPARICVTGGAGFIGSHLVEGLLARGVLVRVVDNFCPDYDPALKRANLEQVKGEPGLSILEGDVRDPRLLDEALQGVDALVHLAAKGGVRRSIQAPGEYWAVNVSGPLAVLQACQRAGVGQALLASSSSIYGDQGSGPAAEASGPGRPLSVYAATKQATEQLGLAFHIVHGLDLTSLRFFSVYGPRVRPDLVMHIFCRKLRAGKALPVFGDLTSARDYTYVGDVVRGIMAALEPNPGPARHRVFNLGAGQPAALSRLIEVLEQEVGVKATLERLPAQPGDVRCTWADTSLCARELGAGDFIPLDRGVRELVRWMA